MKSSRFSRWAFSVCTVALVAACGGTQSSMGASGVVPQARVVPDGTYKVTGPLLYVADFISNRGFGDIRIFPASADNKRPFATITNDIMSPAGDCLDSHGTLYVTNEPNDAGWVSEYPLGQTKASLVIKDGINGPGYCAIDASGNLWVTNIGGATVTEYLPGSKKPHAKIHKGLAYPVGVAFDSSGNLYVSDRQNSDVVIYAPGSETPSRTITDGVTSPVAIAIDASGILYIANITERNVEEYQPGADEPFQTIIQGLPTPAGVTVNEKGWLYVANGSGINHLIAEFPPGAITPSRRHLSKGLHDGSNGVAYYPPVLP